MDLGFSYVVNLGRSVITLFYSCGWVWIDVNASLSLFIFMVLGSSLPLETLTNDYKLRLILTIGHQLFLCHSSPPSSGHRLAQASLCKHASMVDML